MHKNKIWLTFLFLCGLVVLWHTGTTAYKLFYYSRLQAHTQTQSIEWSIKELSEEKYVLNAAYTFIANGKEYGGKMSFNDDYHRNSWSAEKTMQTLRTGPSQQVWYSPSNPEYSTLQKTFPMKDCIYAAILWALLLYFCWIGVYVTRYQ